MKKLIVMSVFLVFAFMSVVLMAQQRAPQVPAATGPMLDLANKLAEAINKQDAAALQKMVAPDAVYLDEDGHAPPVQAWINRLTMGTPPKQMTISQTHGQTWDNSGWVSFNYTLGETYQGNPKMLKGTASVVAKKAASGDWQITLIHGALEQKVANITQ
jgi:ketosteroid isomerase-like protein